MSPPEMLPAGTRIGCLFCGHRDALAVAAPAWFILHCPKCGSFGPLSSWAQVAKTGERR